ncbi:MAG: ATP-binding protein, partial [Micromonosporaceae bacterium]
MRTVLDRVSLRVKLVAAVLVIVTAALTGISVPSIAALQGYLLNRVDDELHLVAKQLLQQVATGETSLELSGVFGSPAETVLPNSPYVVETRSPKGGVQSWWPRGDQESSSQAQPDDPNWPQVPDAPKDLVGHLSEPFIVQSVGDQQRWRLLIEPLPGDQFLVVGASLAKVDSIVDRLTHLNLLVGLMVLAGVAVIAVAVVWASLRPLGEIERTASAIAAGDLSRRVPDRDPHTEVGRLALVLNVMLNQIETSFSARARSEAAARRSEERMRRFVADASHELRSPLTSIRGFAELYRHGGVSDPGDVGGVMRRIEDEASRMSLLVEDLLLLARLDQQRPIAWEPVDLLDLATHAAEAARAVSPDRSITLTVGPGSGQTMVDAARGVDDPAASWNESEDSESSENTPQHSPMVWEGPPIVMGDEARLRQVLDNLVRNALIHTPAGTPVEIRVWADAETAVLEVADQGPGLDQEQADRVFERFYRADPARSRRHGSAGLGLAIVAALAAAHDG